MGVHLITLAITPLLLLGSTNAETKRDDADKGEEVEVRYRPFGDGRHEFSSAVHYAPSAHLDVGWRVVARHYSRSGPGLAGWQVTIGPLWAAVVGPKNGSVGFRAEVNPWMAVVTSFVDPASSKPVRVPLGADFSGLLYGSVRLGKGLRVSPGVSIMTNAARSSTVPGPNPETWDPTARFWDRQTGWRFLLPMWLGTQRKFKIEGGYTHLTKQGVYFAPERWTVACGWVF
jgi:hypothetical protein